jgi:hypothetical protein
VIAVVLEGLVMIHDWRLEHPLDPGVGLLGIVTSYIFLCTIIFIMELFILPSYPIEWSFASPVAENSGV